MNQAPTRRAPSECHLPHQPLGKYLLEILKCVVTTRVGIRGYSDVAFFRQWVFIYPLVFEIVMNFIRYGALSTTGLSIGGWLCFKDNEGNALNV